MLLVDDRTVFIGGMNIADEYYRGRARELPWRDNMLEISGHGCGTPAPVLPADVGAGRAAAPQVSAQASGGSVP